MCVCVCVCVCVCAQSGSAALSYRNRVINPGWRLMQAGYSTRFHAV